MRNRRCPYQCHPGNWVRRCQSKLKLTAGRENRRRLFDHRTRGWRAVGIEQIWRVVDFGIQVALWAGRSTAACQQAAVGQQDRGGVIQPRLLCLWAHGNRAGDRVEQFNRIPDLPAHLVVHLAATRDRDRPVCKHGRVRPMPAGNQIRQAGLHRRDATEIDYPGLARSVIAVAAANLQHLARGKQCRG